MSTFLSPADTNSGRRRTFRPSWSGGRSSSSKKAKQDSFQIQMELAELRKRIKILDGDTGRNELLDLLQEKDDEILQKEKQLHKLNDKLHEINKGVEAIQEERQKIRQTAEQLQTEKKHVQQRLDMREKEVLSLVRRCTSQEERMKESSTLRTSNSELVNEVGTLKSKLQERDDALVNMVALQRELSECKEAKEELSCRLAQIKKEHDAVTETLNTSFANMQKMSESLVEKDEERRREQQRAQLELEQQRLEHLQATNQLKEELQQGQQRIEQMEKTLQERISQNTLLRQEMEEWKKNREEEISNLKDEHNRDQSALVQSHEVKLQSLQKVHNGTVDRLNSELEAKGRVVATLEKEISHCMEKMMMLSSDLQNVQEERNGEGSQLAEAIERLELERSTLRDQLSSKEAETIELTASVCRFESDNILLKQETTNLRDRVQQLEEGRAKVSELKEQLRKAVESLSLEQDRRARIEEENEKRVESLETDLEEQGKMWVSMEMGLQENLAAVLAEKRTMQEELETRVNECQVTIRSLQQSLAAKDKTIANMEAQLASLQRTSEQSALSAQEEIDQLKDKLRDATNDLALKDDEIRDLKLFELKDSQETVAALQAEVRSLTQTVSSKEMEGAEVVSDLELHIEQLQNKSSAQDRIISDMRQQHDLIVGEWKQELSDLQEDKSALEVEMKSQSSKLQERHSTITSLTKKNTLLEQRERTMRAELDLLIAAQEKSKSEQQKLFTALEREVDRERTRREDDDLIHQEKQAELEKKLSEIEAKLEAQLQLTSDVEGVLHARTKLLGDMVAHNKSVETELHEEQTRAAELEKTLEAYEIEKQAAEAEQGRMKGILQSKEDQFLETIHKERHLREIAESDLHAANMRLSHSKRDTKEVSELEKENSELKDKVRRQEAYLKRKLQKEKVLRDRNSGNKKNIMATPSDENSKVRNGNRGTGNRFGYGSNRTVSNPAYSTSSSTFPNEWESD